MEELFGIPMVDIMVVMLALLFACLAVIAFIAWRRPVIFKLGIRNIPRRKAQTVLIIVGLMLSTLIIAAAFGTGDTLNHSVTTVVYRQLGPVDEHPLVSARDVERAEPLGFALLAQEGEALAVGVPQQALRQLARERRVGMDALDRQLLERSCRERRRQLNEGAGDEGRNDVKGAARRAAEHAWISREPARTRPRGGDGPRARAGA